MRNTINANELNEIISLAKNKNAWEKKYGTQSLADVLKYKTGRETVSEIQTMTKLPPRRLKPVGSRIPKGFVFSHKDARGLSVYVEKQN